MTSTNPSNFGHLKAHDEQLVRLGLLAGTDSFTFDFLVTCSSGRC